MVKNVRVTVTGPMPINISTGALIRGTHGPMAMGEKDLFKCIAAGAIVNEVIKTGLEMRLDFTNYQTNNLLSPVKRPTPKPVDNSYINNGPAVKVAPVTLDRSLHMAEEVRSNDDTETSNVVEEVPVDNTAMVVVDNESPKHWQAPPKEKRNKKH